MPVHPVPPVRSRRVSPRRRGRAARRSFARSLILVAAGGFAGTLAVLQQAPPLPAFADLPARAAAVDPLSAHFGLCSTGGGRDCVVDGDTFRFAGEKYRIADIDTPETHPPRGAEEARLGAAATRRLQGWLNAGAFRLETVDRDSDRYGRKLRIVTRGGESVGAMLVAEGLARRWDGRRRPWCREWRKRDGRR